MKKKESTKDFLINNTKGMFKDIFSGDKERFKRQFANLLTMSRGILAPILIIISIIIHSLTMSFIVIALSALTDCFDGWYARHNNYVSEFGALLDMICDKIFILCVILPIMKVNLPIYLKILILEVLISIVNSYFHFKGYNPKTRIIGKIKTIFLDVTLIACYLSLLITIKNQIIEYLLTITIIFQLVTCLDYIYVKIKK